MQNPFAKFGVIMIAFIGCRLAIDDTAADADWNSSELPEVFGNGEGDIKLKFAERRVLLEIIIVGRTPIQLEGLCDSIVLVRKKIKETPYNLTLSLPPNCDHLSFYLRNNATNPNAVVRSRLLSEAEKYCGGYFTYSDSCAKISDGFCNYLQGNRPCDDDCIWLREKCHFDCRAFAVGCEKNQSLFGHYVSDGKYSASGSEDNCILCSLNSIGYLSIGIAVLCFFLCISLCSKHFSMIPREGIRSSAWLLHEKSPDLELRINVCQSVGNPFLSADYEIDRHGLKHLQESGSGSYGRVFKAARLCTSSLVAIKIAGDDECDVEILKHEAICLKELRHPNIIQLVGVCSIAKPFCIVLEYMHKGDLKTYLRGATLSELSVDCLVHICIQVSYGLQYLAEQLYVHRDIAARNCLVSMSNTVKIADFAFAEKLEDSSAFFRIDPDRDVPVRWMAVETLMHDEHYLASDMWAFGVLMWEVFTWGKVPYHGLTNQEVVSAILKGNVLPCPTGTPDYVYSIMMSCWNAELDKRPSLTRSNEIVKLLTTDKVVDPGTNYYIPSS